MITIKAIILTVALFSTTDNNFHVPPPHKYYPTEAACRKAGEQRVRAAKDAGSKLSKTITTSILCEEQTILIPRAEN